ncbi:unannotated protein [freshwater metagenome]|uniref:Unannotated protein n=1 Tax=freshwater metagenome TaxID=449393 RepID=A0A6J7F5P1_9ZZZZ
MSVMSLDAKLLQILACPQDKGPLFYFESEGFLYNPRLQRKYNIVEGIPVMLIDEATSVDAVEHEGLSQRITQERIAPTFG